MLNKKGLVFVVGVTFILITYSVFITGKHKAEGLYSTQAEDTLKLINGEQSITYTLNEIETMTNYITGYGGYKKTTGTIVGPFEYKGIPIVYLLDAVGGINSSQDLTVIASDGYEVDYTYEEIQGNVTTYNSTTGEEITDVDVTMTLIYEEIGQEELEGGPLRIGYLSDEGHLTDGSKWAKYVAKLVIEEPPENGNGDNSPIDETPFIITTAIFSLISLGFIATIVTIQSKNKQ